MDDEQHINDALPDLLVGAIATYEMYKNYQQAGFTPDEALRLIAYMLKTHPHPPTT
jgi:hypothetical protein